MVPWLVKKPPPVMVKEPPLRLALIVPALTMPLVLRLNSDVSTETYLPTWSIVTLAANVSVAAPALS